MRLQRWRWLAALCGPCSQVCSHTAACLVRSDKARKLCAALLQALPVDGRLWCALACMRCRLQAACWRASSQQPQRA